MYYHYVKIINFMSELHRLYVANNYRWHILYDINFTIDTIGYINSNVMIDNNKMQYICNNKTDEPKNQFQYPQRE